MKSILYKYAYLIPPIQLVATLIVALFPNYTLEISIYLGNSIGYSILTSFIYLKHFILMNKKYCLFTKVSVLGIFVLSVFNFIGYSFYDNYVDYECKLTVLTFFISILLLIVLYIQKKE